MLGFRTFFGSYLDLHKWFTWHAEQYKVVDAVTRYLIFNSVLQFPCLYFVQNSLGPSNFQLLWDSLDCRLSRILVFLKCGARLR